MALSWNEIKDRALNFSKEWADTSNEEADAKPFLVEFFNVFGISSKRFSRAIAFSSLIIGNVFLILTSLSETRNFLAVILEKNIAVLFISILAILLLIMTVSIPFLNNLFSFEFPGYKHFLSAFIGAILMLFALETIKYVKRPKNAVF